jgi:hypothetical protein
LGCITNEWHLAIALGNLAVSMSLSLPMRTPKVPTSKFAEYEAGRDAQVVRAPA